MELKEFAEVHSLRVKHSREDDTDNIVGRLGDIYEYGDGQLAVMVMPEPPRRGPWIRSRRKFLELGMTLVQDGDQEGASVFDGSDPQQADAAIQAIRAKKSRKLSLELRLKLIEAGRNTRLRAMPLGQKAL